MEENGWMEFLIKTFGPSIKKGKPRLISVCNFYVLNEIN